MGITPLECDGTVPTICCKKEADVDPKSMNDLPERMDLLFHVSIAFLAAGDLLITDLLDTNK